VPQRTQTAVKRRLAQIRKLSSRLARIRLASGRKAALQAERLAESIQEHAALIRSQLRKLLK
jgi:hypothetical protein